MKIANHLLLPLLAIGAAAGTAAAGPRECRSLDGERWDQHLAYAGCLRSAPLARLTDPEQLRPFVARLESDVERSIGIYRDAMARAPWEMRLLAAYQLGQTYVDLVVRARNAVDARTRPELEPLLVPYIRDAQTAFTQAWAVGEELPAGVACDDLVRNLVAGTRDALDTLELQ